MRFEINNKAELFSVDDERIGTSLIQDFNEKNLFISVPIEKGIKKSLETGDSIKLVYYDETHLYLFESIVEGRLRDKIMMYKLTLPEEFEVVQRREDFRLPIVLDMKYFKVKPVELADINEMDTDQIQERFKDDFRECLSLDISGQGIGLLIDENLAIGDELLVLSPNPSFNVVLNGHIVHKQKMYRSKGFKYKVGIRFLDQSYGTKEKIVGFVFKKMRDQLKARIK